MGTFAILDSKTDEVLGVERGRRAAQSCLDDLCKQFPARQMHLRQDTTRVYTVITKLLVA